MLGAHLNEIRHIRKRNPGCPEAQAVLDRLREIHRIGLEAGGTLQARRRVRNLLRRRVKRIIAVYGRVPALGDFLTKKLRNAEQDLFLYVLDPRVASTNNAAERGLREPGVHPVGGDNEVVGTPVHMRHDLKGTQHGHPCGTGKIRLGTPHHLHNRRSNLQVGTCGLTASRR